MATKLTTKILFAIQENKIPKNLTGVVIFRDAGVPVYVGNSKNLYSHIAQKIKKFNLDVETIDIEIQRCDYNNSFEEKFRLIGLLKTSNKLNNDKEWKAREGKNTYNIISPTGDKYTTTNLSEFCNIHGLTHANMCACANGRLRHHKNWRCSK